MTKSETGIYRATCSCGDVATRDTLTTARAWAQEHRKMCQYLSSRERGITISKVVDRV